MNKFTVVAMVYPGDGESERIGIMRVEAESPLKAYHAAAYQANDDYGIGTSYLVIGVLEGWPRDYLNPDQDPETPGEWEEELDIFFQVEGVDWKEALPSPKSAEPY